MEAAKAKKKRKPDSAAPGGGQAQPSTQQPSHQGGQAPLGQPSIKKHKAQNSSHAPTDGGAAAKPAATAGKRRPDAAGGAGKQRTKGTAPGDRAGSARGSAGMQAGPPAKQSKTKAVPEAPGALGRKSSQAQSGWPFPTDYLDHFETSKQALVDLEPALYRLANHLGKQKGELLVYDPYFCMGGIRQHYEQIGIKNLIHENRDFYADVKSGSVPDYDILITNPPYSSDHKERILKFCMDSGKPWALLMPNYVANKQYFQDLASQLVDGADGQPGTAPFFLVPAAKYEYEHPQGTGHGSSPFFSIWFLHLGASTSRVLTWWEKLLAKKADKADGIRVLRTVSDLQESRVVPTWKRPNPRQRKKLKESAAEE